jgi:MFS family permease
MEVSKMAGPVATRRDYRAIARRITRALFLAQSMVSGALIGIATVNPIVAAELSQRVALAGLPPAVLLLATALGAYLWGVIMSRFGRRRALIAGLLLGTAGALISAFAIQSRAFMAFLLGMVFLGLAQAAMQLGRFAAADVHPAETRGRAIANVVLGGTLGAVVGPLLVGPSGAWAGGMGLSSLSGPYLVGLSFFLAGGVILLIGLRPEPLQIARELDQEPGLSDQVLAAPEDLGRILRRPGVIVAVLSMIVGQLVMVMLMVITSLYMKDRGHSLTDVSVVISGHTLGMFAFSIFSGRLADRFGRERVIQIGGMLLLVASLAARLSVEVPPLAASLFLLGLGWNFCYVAGSALLSDHVSSEEQTRVQGANDLLVNLASAAGSLGSGFVFASVGYSAMALIGATFSILPLAAALLWQRVGSRPSEAAA